MIPKFRAWYTPFKGEEFGQEMKYGQAGRLITHAEMSPDKYVLMQSTGMKDKNGVEIFEGDIVKTLGADLEVTFSTIKFEEGAFCVDYKDLGTEFVFLYFVDSPLEVIGNIYENSELLEEQR
ncbi:hypothetical protein KGD03_000865 [Enterococcus hirae]|nr:hypothetical protein [Enterococcus hirae]EMF0297564.1 hypothetical protein [Enterococcus hirae]